MVCVFISADCLYGHDSFFNYLFYSAEREECHDRHKIQMEISNPLHSGR